MVAAVLICDDSNLARKQMARSLPADWQEKISFAGHGQEAMEVLKRQPIDLLFLDLNMPILDGYEVLQAIKEQGIPVKVVVVSGDVQPEAHERVMSYGALDFIRKPVSAEKLGEVLQQFTAVHTEQDSQKVLERALNANLLSNNFALDPILRDVFQELTNVAMGQAGDLLARLLKVFVKLPIPNVNVIEVSELHMAIASVEQKETTSAVCQGFIGGGVSGEALLILNDSSFVDIAKLMKYEGRINAKTELELLMDVGNILIGSVLKGLAEQIDMSFSQGHPVVLGQHAPVRHRKLQHQL